MINKKFFTQTCRERINTENQSEQFRMADMELNTKIMSTQHIATLSCCLERFKTMKDHTKNISCVSISILLEQNF